MKTTFPTRIIEEFRSPLLSTRQLFCWKKQIFCRQQQIALEYSSTELRKEKQLILPNRLLIIFYFRNEITRVSYTVPLREHFSLPFFYAMLVSVARFFNICQRSTNKANTNIWSTKVLNCYVINNSLFFCLIMYLVQSYSLWFFSFFQKFVLVQVYVMTFIFVITWQFAQFALLLHSLLCFILATAQLLNKNQVRI